MEDNGLLIMKIMELIQGYLKDNVSMIQDLEDNALFRDLENNGFL